MKFYIVISHHDIYVEKTPGHCLEYNLNIIIINIEVFIPQRQAPKTNLAFLFKSFDVIDPTYLYIILIASLLTMSVPYEGFSNLLTMSVPYEGFP